MSRVFNYMADWAGSGKYRAIIPSIALADCGHETMCSDDIGVIDQDGNIFCAQADVWIGHRVDRDDVSDLFEIMAVEERGNSVLALDVDDNIWNIHPSNQAYGYPNLDRLSRNCVVADVVTVCSHGLAEVVKTHAPTANVVVVPNCVPSDMLDLPAPKAQDGPVRLGFGGSHSHIIDMPVLHDVLQKVEGDWRLRQLGHPFHMPIDPLKIEYRQWSHNLTGYYQLLDFDIGLAPLAEEDFNRGKSDLKLLEYMARGIPWVASKFGPYAEPDIEQLNGVAGFLVETTDEWLDAIGALMDHPALRVAMGAVGKQWVRDHRTDRHGAHQREEIFGIVDGRGPEGSGTYAVVHKG